MQYYWISQQSAKIIVRLKLRKIGQDKHSKLITGYEGVIMVIYTEERWSIGVLE